MSRNIGKITINQKASFEATMRLKSKSSNTPIDLTGYTVAGKIKPEYTSNTEISFSTVITDAANGEINFSLNANQTSAMSANKYVYDIVITNGSGFKTRVLEGPILISKGVT